LVKGNLHYQDALYNDKKKVENCGRAGQATGNSIIRCRESCCLSFLGVCSYHVNFFLFFKIWNWYDL